MMWPSIFKYIDLVEGIRNPDPDNRRPYLLDRDNMSKCFFNDLFPEILAKIFELLDEEDRRELSRVNARLRRFYRFHSKYKFRFHIQGNSWKLLRKGLNKLLHRPNLSKMYSDYSSFAKPRSQRWPIADLEEVKLSKFDLHECFDERLRNFNSILKKSKFEPKPGPLNHVKKLIISDCILTLKFLHYLCKTFPMIKTLEIRRCAMWFSTFDEPRPKWKLDILSLTCPVATNCPGVMMKLLEFVDSTSGTRLSINDSRVSVKRPVHRRFFAKYKKYVEDSPNSHEIGRDITIRNVPMENHSDLVTGLEDIPNFDLGGFSIEH